MKRRERKRRGEEGDGEQKKEEWRRMKGGRGSGREGGGKEGDALLEDEEGKMMMLMSKCQSLNELIDSANQSNLLRHHLLFLFLAYLHLTCANN